jgi:hypothetical protein
MAADGEVEAGVRSSGTPGYEAPRVETVLTPDAIEREILYAGPTGTVDGT